jgi:hypothetical protein
LVLTGGALVAALAVAAPALRDRSATDYQQKAERAVWEWDDDRATFDKSLAASGYRGDVQVLRLDFGKCVYTLRPAGSAAEVRFGGHGETVVAVCGGALYYADFSPIASGCAVVAVDLTTGEQLWRAELRGLGPVDHSKYRNRVILDVDRNAVRVLGKESSGRYIEYLDRKSGRTVGHKVFKD